MSEPQDLKLLYNRISFTANELPRHSCLQKSLMLKLSTDFLRYPPRNRGFTKGSCVIPSGAGLGPRGSIRVLTWGKPGCAGEGTEGNEGKTMDRWGGGWASASCGFWPSWPRASQVINATQLLLAGHRSPLPLTLCTSKRSSAAVHTRRSAPGCAGLPGGAPSCTSFQPQSAPGAHRCSSGREEIRDAGKQEHGSGS